MKCKKHWKPTYYHYQLDSLGNTHLVERCKECNRCKRFISLREVDKIIKFQPEIKYELSTIAKKILKSKNQQPSLKDTLPDKIRYDGKIYIRQDILKGTKSR